MKAWVSLLISTALATSTLLGCATSYVGPRPDFSKTGPEAITEYKKFEIDERMGGVTLATIAMGNEDYHRETVVPIISDVSSSAVQKLNDMRVWWRVDIGLMLATLIMAFQPRDTWSYQTGYWIGLGAVLGTGIYIDRLGVDAAKVYNRDLRSKFNPAISLSFRFD